MGNDFLHKTRVSARNTPFRDLSMRSRPQHQDGNKKPNRSGTKRLQQEEEHEQPRPEEAQELRHITNDMVLLAVTGLDRFPLNQTRWDAPRATESESYSYSSIGSGSFSFRCNGSSCYNIT